MTAQEKNNKMKLIELNSLDNKRPQISKKYRLYCKSWKLERITTLNEM